MQLYRKPELSRHIKLNHTNIALLLQEVTQKYQKLTDYWTKSCYLSALLVISLCLLAAEFFQFLRWISTRQIDRRFRRETATKLFRHETIFNFHINNFEHVYMRPEVNSNRFEISLRDKISLRCEVTSLAAFTWLRVEWNSLRCKFHFVQIDQSEISNRSEFSM